MDSLAAHELAAVFEKLRNPDNDIPKAIRLISKSVRQTALQLCTKDLYVSEQLVSQCLHKGTLASTLCAVKADFLSIQLLSPPHADFVFANLNIKRGTELEVALSGTASVFCLPTAAEVGAFWRLLVAKLAASPPCGKMTIKLQCETVALDFTKLPHLDQYKSISIQGASHDRMPRHAVTLPSTCDLQKLDLESVTCVFVGGGRPKVRQLVLSENACVAREELQVERLRISKVSDTFLPKMCIFKGLEGIETDMHTLGKLPELHSVQSQVKCIKLIDFVPEIMTEDDDFVPETFSNLVQLSGNGFLVPSNLPTECCLESVRVFLPDDGSDCHKLWNCTGLSHLALYGSQQVATDQKLVEALFKNNPDILTLELYDIELADFSVVRRLLPNLHTLQLSCCSVQNKKNYLDVGGMRLDVFDVDSDSAKCAVSNMTLVEAKKCCIWGLADLQFWYENGNNYKAPFPVTQVLHVEFQLCPLTVGEAEQMKALVFRMPMLNSLTFDGVQGKLPCVRPVCSTVVVQNSKLTDIQGLGFLRQVDHLLITQTQLNDGECCSGMWKGLKQSKCVVGHLAVRDVGVENPELLFQFPMADYLAVSVRVRNQQAGDKLGKRKRGSVNDVVDRGLPEQHGALFVGNTAFFADITNLTDSHGRPVDVHSTGKGLL